MLTQTRLKELFDYDPSTGSFVWKTGKRIAKIAGGKDDQGYWVISINKKSYLAHRLAWLYHYGIWPDSLDHINRIRDDNRIGNLREADAYQNNINKITLPHNNKTGFRGVGLTSRNKRNAKSKPYYSRISVRGKDIYLGYFKTPEEAAAAYQVASRKYHGEFAPGK